MRLSVLPYRFDPSTRKYNFEPPANGTVDEVTIKYGDLTHYVETEAAVAA